MRKAMIAALGLLAAACGAGPAEPPVLVEPSQIEPLLEHSGEFNGRRVAIDGYVHIDDENGRAAAMVYTLTSRPRGLGEELIRFEAERGAAANQLDLPVLKTQLLPQMAGGEILLLDVKNGRFVDSAGVAHPVRDKVRVTGTVASGPAVEDERAPTGWRHRPRLTNVSFEAAP